jgi:hypothetical protein
MRGRKQALVEAILTGAFRPDLRVGCCSVSRCRRSCRSMVARTLRPERERVRLSAVLRVGSPPPGTPGGGRAGAKSLRRRTGARATRPWAGRCGRAVRCSPTRRKHALSGPADLLYHAIRRALVGRLVRTGPATVPPRIAWACDCAGPRYAARRWTTAPLRFPAVSSTPIARRQ